MHPDSHSPISPAQEDGGIPLSTPPDGFEFERRWSLGASDELSGLRAQLADALSAYGQEAKSLADTPAKLVLIASELTANALEHGLPPTIVSLLRREDMWLIDVADYDLRSGPIYAGIRIAGAGGIGMHLARELSLRVGWYTTEETKHVWATFPVDTS